MSKLRCHISISADGFVAGPNPTLEEPLGRGATGTVCPDAGRPVVSDHRPVVAELSLLPT